MFRTRKKYVATLYALRVQARDIALRAISSLKYTTLSNTEER